MGILRLTEETCKEIICKDNIGNDDEKFIRKCIEEYYFGELCYRTHLTEDDIDRWADVMEYEIELCSERDEYVEN